MNTLSVLDTSIANYNLGNEIIMDSVYKNVYEIFTDCFFYKIPYMDMTTHALSCLGKSRVVIWGGTNSLCGEMEKYTQWGINAKNVKYVTNKIVLMGLGWWQYQEKISRYTKKLFQYSINNEYLSSVRDQYSANKLKEIGFENIINTGCPTLWMLVPEHCSGIPNEISSETAVVTITDYKKDRDRDFKLFSIVKKQYKNVVLWPQGVGDYHYVKNNLCISDIQILTPHLKCFDDFLIQYKPDYIGTRLHGGIRALQKKCRAIIISVDNRAIEMGRDFQLPVIDISQLEEMISKKFPQIMIPINNIIQWKKQFVLKK